VIQDLGFRMDVSIIVRTYNEQAHIGDLLAAIEAQEGALNVEVIIVDSGSTDRTLDIAAQWDCRVVYIDKEQFTFGRSLNMGCASARSDILVFVSGHCVPASPQWLQQIVEPLLKGSAYCYGNQLPHESTRFSEARVFAKYFDSRDHIPQTGYFVNNANAALRSEVWRAHPFDEELSGLEDMELARRLIAANEEIAYVAAAGVFHIHDETWAQVRWRYEREALALRHIDPQLHMSFLDLVRCVGGSIARDIRAALREGCLMGEFAGICAFRVCQYWGSYRGSQVSRRVSRQRRRHYFYPDSNSEPSDLDTRNEDSRSPASESA